APGHGHRRRPELCVDRRARCPGPGVEVTMTTGSTDRNRRSIPAIAALCAALIVGEAAMAHPHSSGLSFNTGTPEIRWKLVWSDEFDKDGPPDARNWTAETGFVRNNELQWYQPENVRCENGLLVIEARRERK